MYSYELHQIISNRFLVSWPLLVFNSLPLLVKWRPPGQVQTFDSGWLHFFALGHTTCLHTTLLLSGATDFCFIVALWCSLSFVFNSSLHPLAGIFIVLKPNNLLSSCSLSPEMRCSQTENVQLCMLGKQHFCKVKKWKRISIKQNSNLMPTSSKSAWNMLPGLMASWTGIFKISLQYCMNIKIFLGRDFEKTLAFQIGASYKLKFIWKTHSEKSARRHSDGQADYTILDDLLIGQCIQFSMFNHFPLCRGCFIALSWHSSCLHIRVMEYKQRVLCNSWAWRNNMYYK